MKSKNLIPVQGVYSLDGWTQWNPLLIAENRPADISSVPLIHRPSKILNRLSKTMHSAASLRKKGKILSLPLHAQSKHMGIRNILVLTPWD